MQFAKRVLSLTDLIPHPWWNPKPWLVDPFDQPQSLLPGPYSPKPFAMPYPLMPPLSMPPIRSLPWLLSLLGKSTPLKYATHIAADAKADMTQYISVLNVRCPPTPVQPEGKLVFGYHLTLKRKGSGSPITIRVGGSREIEYAVAAAIVPGARFFGAACNSTFILVLTCR